MIRVKIIFEIGQYKTSSRITPAPIVSPTANPDRATSPIDPVILEDFHQQPGGAEYQISRNPDRTRRFRIQPANQRTLFIHLHCLTH